MKTVLTGGDNGPALVPGKARTAIAFRQPTLAFGASVTDPGRMVFTAGACPLDADGVAERTRPQALRGTT